MERTRDKKKCHVVSHDSEVHLMRYAEGKRLDEIDSVEIDR